MALEQQVLHDTFSNGLTLVAQPMPWLESAAFSIAVPAGFRYDPADKIGLANFVCEMVQRGCGELDSRRFVEALDLLGVDYSSSAGVYNTNFGGAMQADQLLDAISIFADVVRRPRLPADQLDDGRLVCFQEIKSLEDDLSQQTLMAIRHRFYGDPDGRHCEGTMESVAAIEQADIESFFEQVYRPNGLIIACAGKLDWDSLRDHVEELFGDWQPKPDPVIKVHPPQHGMHHIPYESEQTHIAIAYPGIPYSHDDYFLQRGAIGVLSGGMSSRLFAEVREKRGLCYTVFASSSSLKDRGAILCYSGTSSDRAQQTLDVLIEQLLELANGIRDDELQRLKIQIRSGLVMAQESCRARASSIAGDWFHLGRVRTLDEINETVNGLSVDSINKYLSENPPANFDVVTLGSQPLEMKNYGVSPTPVG